MIHGCLFRATFGRVASDAAKMGVRRVREYQNGEGGVHEVHPTAHAMRDLKISSRRWRSAAAICRRSSEDVAAQVLVLHQLPEVRIDVLRVDGHGGLAVARP